MRKNVDPRAGKPGRRPKPRPESSSATSVEELITEILELIDSGALQDEELSLSRKHDLFNLMLKKKGLNSSERDLLERLLYRLTDRKTVALPTYWYGEIFRGLEMVVHHTFYAEEWYDVGLAFPAISIEEIEETASHLKEDIALLKWIMSLCNDLLELTIPRDHWGSRRRELVFDLLKVIQELVDLPEFVDEAEKRLKAGKSDAHSAKCFLDCYFDFHQEE